MMAVSVRANLKDIFEDTPPEKLDQPCQDDHLCKIAHHITDWPALAPLMGITAPEMEEIREKWPFSLGGQRMVFMRKWKEKHGRKGTYQRLCKAFWKAGEVAVAEKVCKVLCSQESSSESSSDETVQEHASNLHSSSDPQPKSLQPKLVSSSSCVDSTLITTAASSDPLQPLADYLRMTYGCVTPSFIALQWPPPPTLKVFNLVLIQSEETVRVQPLDENLIRLTVTGRVDDVMKMKTSIELEDLFQGQGKKRKVVLVEGAPGSGKSTLAYDICQKWEAQVLFHDDFKVIIYVQFQDLDVQSAQEITDLIPFMLQSERKNAASLIEACHGEGVLFVLDGWDEYTRGLQEGSLFEKLICHPEQLSVQLSTVLITSRPIASGSLQKYATTRVEIVGFTPEEVGQYFENVFKDTMIVQKLHDHLQERPLIKASCYLPLNTAIVAHLFKELNYTLPTTLHGLFSSLVLSCIIRHLTKDLGSEPDVTSLDDLPPAVQEIFQNVCVIACEGVMHNKVIFSSQDLQSYGLTKDLNALSLMQVVQSFATGKPKSYHFLHLSIQELLAAQLISNLLPLEQVQIFTELFGQPRFDAVFRYYAAFTKLQTEGIRDIVAPVVQSTVSVSRQGITEIRNEDKAHLLNLMHCLYEARDVSLCHFVSSQLKGTLDLRMVTLSSFDLLSLKYFLLCVNDSSTGPAGGNNTDSCDVTVSELIFKYCSLTPEDIDSLSLCNLVKLDLTSNRLSCACAANLLTNNPQLKELQLVHCILTDDGIEVFAATLRDHCSLEVLDLYHCTGITHGMHHIFQAILSHRSLRNIDITYCHVDMKDVAAVLEVNTSLQELSLGAPHDFVGTILIDSDSVILAKSLRKNKILKTLGLRVTKDQSCDWLEAFALSLQDCHLRTLKVMGLRLEDWIAVPIDQVNDVRSREGLPPLEIYLL